MPTCLSYMRLQALNCINASYYPVILLCPGGKKSSSFLLPQTVTIVDSKATPNRDTEGLPPSLAPRVNSLIFCCNLLVMAVASYLVFSIILIIVSSYFLCYNFRNILRFVKRVIAVLLFLFNKGAGYEKR